jgi:hypothetical protein
VPTPPPGKVHSEDNPVFAVHVRQASAGNWWIVDLHGEVLSQWPSEFAAIDAGRLNARRFALPLVIHDGYTDRTEHLPADED